VSILSLFGRILYMLRSAHAHNVLFSVSWKSSEVAIRFSDTELLRKSNNLPIRRLQLFSLYRSKVYFWSIWPNDHEHVSRVPL